MKIIGGEFRGRRLYSPKDYSIRPTSDKIRGAIFNMLYSRNALENTNILDGFCGTGALGLEALSRGASHCTFIDNSRTSLNLARDNAKMLGVLNKCNFSLTDILKIKENKDQYNLIFLDPPYNKNLILPTIGILQNNNLISPNCWIVCESEREFLPNNIDQFIINNEKIYGDIKVTLLKNY